MFILVGQGHGQAHGRFVSGREQAPYPPPWDDLMTVPIFGWWAERHFRPSSLRILTRLKAMSGSVAAN